MSDPRETRSADYLPLRNSSHLGVDQRQELIVGRLITTGDLTENSVSSALKTGSFNQIDERVKRLQASRPLRTKRDLPGERPVQDAEDPLPVTG